MKRFIYALLVVIFTACTTDLENVRVEGDLTTSDKILNNSTDCNKGSIIVRFNGLAESRLAQCATRSGSTRTGVEGVDALFAGVDGYTVEPIFVVTERNRENVYRRGLHLWYVLRFDEKCDVEILANALANVDEVQVVEFSHGISRVTEPKQVDEVVSRSLRAVASAPSASVIPFNDTYRNYQWSLNNLGENSPVFDAGMVAGLAAPMVGADVNVVPAWKLCMGDPSIVVAVMDEAVMYTHEDLADNMWVNVAERDGEEWVDDDDNGFVDDVYGYNFAMGDKVFPLSWDNPEDTGHGSHVAGIISAVNNNGIGISGIAGGSGKKDGVKILSLQAFLGNGTAKPEYMAKAMQYAADNGAHILQCSWIHNDGYSILNDKSYRGGERGVIATAIDYFVEVERSADSPINGGVAIFAAGNNGNRSPAYPAAYEPCVAVAAMSPSLRPAYYTDYGVGVDIVAPGGSYLYNNGAILSTVPAKFASEGFPNYAVMQGTSQACPHVSGVAALGLSYAKKLGKRYSASEFRSLLLSATNDIEPYLIGSISSAIYGINVNYANYKGKLGAGYIDAYKLLLQIDGTPYTTVKRGENFDIDLAPYFGDGVYNAELHEVIISDEDVESVGFGDYSYSGGKLRVNCSKSGAATLTVTMLVGGGNLDDNSRPFPTKVTKKFVVMVRDGVAVGGGWL